MKQRNKRLLSASMAAAMLIPQMSIVSYAEETVTTVGSEAELIAAVENGGTIKIDADIELTAPLVATRDVTLIADKAVTITDKNSKGDLLTANGATLTLGKNITATSAISTLWAYNGGTIIIDGADIVDTHAKYCLGAAYANSTIKVVSGTVTAAATALNAYGGGTIEIVGGTVKSTSEYVAVFANNNSGTIIISDDAVVISEEGVAVDAHAGCSAEITGGTITGGTGALATEGTGTISVSGGTFSHEVADEYLADGYTTIEDDGAYVVTKKAVASIEITTTPKTEYFVGDELDITGGILTITYNDNTTEEVALDAEGVEIIGFDSTAAREIIVTVTYGEATTTFTVTVTVEEATLTSIELTTAPTKAEYLIGEELDVTGGILTLTYSDNTTEEITLDTEGVEITGFDSSIANDALVVTVSYEGMTDTFTIAIIEDNSVDAPTNVKAIGGSKTAIITWDAVDGATNYSVYIRKGENWVNLGETGTETSYTASGLVNGGKYFFAVKAYTEGVWSDYSETAIAFPTAGIVPQNVSAISGDATATITWDAVDGATNYAILMRKGTEWVTLGASGTNNTYTAKNLVNGGKYFFTVKAYVNGKWSAASDIVTASPIGITPQNVKTISGDTTATITWDAVDGATSYAILMRKGTEWVTLSSSETSNTYTVENLVNGGKYFFVVRAYVDGKWSGDSDIAIAFPGTIVPQNVKAVGGDGTVTISWNAVNDATNYAILMRKGNVWITVGSTGTKTTFTSTGLVNGGKYFFIVKAYADGAWSGASEIVTAFPKA